MTFLQESSMKTTYDMIEQLSRTPFVEPNLEEGALSLSEFNRRHAAEIHRVETQRKVYRNRQRINRVFDAAVLLLIAGTAVATVISLITITLP
jgi:hypothetical protein